MQANYIVHVIGYFKKCGTQSLIYSRFLLSFNFFRKSDTFSKIFANPLLDIDHPFVWVEPYSNVERSSPKFGWSIDPMRAKNLAEGERSMRNYTLHWLKHEVMDKKIICDPAYSPGLLLYNIAIKSYWNFLDKITI